MDDGIFNPDLYLERLERSIRDSVPAPVALIVSLGFYMDLEKFDCYSNAPDQSKCTLENNWKY